MKRTAVNHERGEVVAEDAGAPFPEEMRFFNKNSVWGEIGARPKDGWGKTRRGTVMRGLAESLLQGVSMA